MRQNNQVFVDTRICNKRVPRKMTPVRLFSSKRSHCGTEDPPALECEKERFLVGYFSTSGVDEQCVRTHQTKVRVGEHTERGIIIRGADGHDIGLFHQFLKRRLANTMA